MTTSTTESSPTTTTCAWCQAVIDATQPWVRTPPRCRRCASKQEQQRVRTQLQRAQRAGLDTTLTTEQWLATLDALGWRCAYCRGPFDLLDHVVPIDQGGGTTALNCAPACRACNAATTHTSARRADIAQLLEHLHATPSSDQSPAVTANALALQFVFVYINALRQGLGVTQSELAQRSDVPLRNLQRYLRQPPDALPNSATFLRLIGAVAADARDMATLLDPGTTRDHAIALAERRLIARLSQPIPDQPLPQINNDMFMLLHTLKGDGALLRATRALVAGWERVDVNDEPT